MQALQETEERHSEQMESERAARGEALAAQQQKHASAQEGACGQVASLETEVAAVQARLEQAQQERATEAEKAKVHCPVLILALS